MDILDYAEASGERSLENTRKAYDGLHERAYKTATALTAGAWAAGGYALSKIGEAGAALQWVPFGVLAFYWFAVACFLILRGATSNPVSQGNGAGDIYAYYSHCLAEPAGDDEEKSARALRETRQAEIALKQGRLEMYGKAGKRRAQAIDWTFRMIAASPVLPGLSALAVWWLRAT